jgi:hypothetical protein
LSVVAANYTKSIEKGLLPLEPALAMSYCDATAVVTAVGWEPEADESPRASRSS